MSEGLKPGFVTGFSSRTESYMSAKAMWDIIKGRGTETSAGVPGYRFDSQATVVIDVVVANKVGECQFYRQKRRRCMS